MDKRFTLEFGALSDPIINQLHNQGLTLSEQDNKRYTELAWAITMVKLHGLIADGVCDQARHRLMKMISKSVVLLNPEKE